MDINQWKVLHTSAASSCLRVFSSAEVNVHSDGTMVKRRRAPGQTACPAGRKDESTRSKKRRTRSDPEPVRTRRRTEAGTPSCSQPAAETPERTKSVLLSISRGESILDR